MLNKLFRHGSDISISHNASKQKNEFTILPNSDAKRAFFAPTKY
jgi:hypothetical protein